jgi:hypothetical protein
MDGAAPGMRFPRSMKRASTDEAQGDQIIHGLQLFGLGIVLFGAWQWAPAPVLLSS